MSIKVNQEICNGCLSCMTICSMVNESYVSLSGARVQVELSPLDGQHQISICRQCAEARCAEACPVEAITRDPAGYLTIDYDRCTSCQACVQACPFHAIFWNPISDKVIKCELCHGQPQCVSACATGALTIEP